jgi:fructokinase
MLKSGKQLGGAPANFTFHCRSLGADARLVTRIGDDPLGREVLDRFRALGLPAESVQRDATWPTGTVDVDVTTEGQPRFTIREDAAWDWIAADETAVALARATDAICFGSLAQRSETSRKSIRQLVAMAPPLALRIFDVNLRHPFVNRTVIAESLELANVLKLNDQELPELGAMFQLPSDVRAAMAELGQRFGLSVVALTRGAQGSLLLADGQWADHPGKRAQVRDTIGAGDAFTAALTVGVLAGRPLDQINQHANDVAAFVCSQDGGTPSLPAALKEPACS